MCEDNDGGSSSTSSISHHSDLENVTIETVAKNDGSGDTSVVNLLRREFGQRSTFFSVSSEDYMDERRRKRLVSKKGHVSHKKKEIFLRTLPEKF